MCIGQSDIGTSAIVVPSFQVRQVDGEDSLALCWQVRERGENPVQPGLSGLSRMASVDSPKETHQAGKLVKAGTQLYCICPLLIKVQGIG